MAGASEAKKHRYAIADFGLTDQNVLDRYAAYIDHFKVEREASH